MQISGEIHLEPYKSKISRKTLQFHGVQWESYVRWISHEIRRILHEIRYERPTIARNGKAYVWSHL